MWIWTIFFFSLHTAMEVVAYDPLTLQAEHLVLCEVSIATTTQWDRMSMMLSGSENWWCINDFCVKANGQKKREKKRRPITVYFRARVAEKKCMLWNGSCNRVTRFYCLKIKRDILNILIFFFSGGESATINKS